MKSFPAILSLLLALSVFGCESPSNTLPMPKGPPRYPRPVPMAIDPKLQAAARAQIRQSLHSNDEIIRSHALETLAEDNLPDWSTEIVDALGDQSSLVRKSAALAAGQLKVTAAAARLPELLDAESNARAGEATHATQERIAAIFALHRLGNTSYSHELEKTLEDPRPQVRGDTAMVLGLIGDKSAIPLLIPVLHTDIEPNIRLQAADSLWRMGNEDGEDALITFTISSYTSDEMLAAMALAAPRDTQVLGHIQGLFSSDYLEVRLVAARACAMLGDGEGYGVAMEGAESVDPRQRALAALVYGAIARPDSQPRLAKLLKDTNEEVRIAAAGALVAIGQK